eukprot:GHUV01031065.1.p1 GENE.GHUV01031065.1~~GHUV01031065.1.p1  ORF type:complete len:145 (-),score=17.03 GHUV01031065.1:579-1013(-)
MMCCQGHKMRGLEVNFTTARMRCCGYNRVLASALQSSADSGVVAGNTWPVSNNPVLAHHSWCCTHRVLQVQVPPNQLVAPLAAPMCHIYCMYAATVSAAYLYVIPKVCKMPSSHQPITSVVARTRNNQYSPATASQTPQQHCEL